MMLVLSVSSLVKPPSRARLAPFLIGKASSFYGGQNYEPLSTASRDCPRNGAGFGHPLTPSFKLKDCVFLWVRGIIQYPTPSCI